MSPTSVWRILRKTLNSRAHRIQILQAIHLNDYSKRQMFCKVPGEMIIMDPELRNNILWSDEATFHLSGNVNKWNCHIWGQEKPTTVREHDRDSHKVR
ncbi:hypothetical protein C0J52_18486 [Blattella germanica]|nr:hypothetical protein C0J52_18486 [Blattella germanica]